MNNSISTWQKAWIPLLFLFISFACKKPQTDGSQAAATGEAVHNNATAGNTADAVIEISIPNHPLRSEEDLDVLMEAIGDARVVLLGEASHGTSEYYSWRSAISRRLIDEKGFDFIAVEGEWADSYRVNNFIKGEEKDSTAVIELLEHFNRWPTWMWGNYEVGALVQWLNSHNQNKAFADKVGFFGLDVYCLWESMEELMPYLKNADPSLQKAAKRVHKCFQPYSEDGQEYAIAVAQADASCRAQTQRLWKEIQKLSAKGPEKSMDEFVAEQYALVALNAERYYRTMVQNSEESWNIRDRHMMETLKRLLEFHGPDAKAIVWEHNTHVGDARYTDMANAGMVNVGQLAREELGADDVYIVGFGSYEGSVIAAREWGAPFQRMEVPQAREGSWEEMLHQLGASDKIVFSKDIQDSEYLLRPIGHRAIGVVYHPQREQWGNYVPSIIPKRYDAFLFFDQTKALHPLGTPPTGNEPPDLYPWGL